MDSGNLSTDLALGILAPASAIRGVDGQSGNPNAQGKERRRPSLKPGPDESPEEDILNGVGPPAHQLDDLA